MSQELLGRAGCSVEVGERPPGSLAARIESVGWSVWDLVEAIQRLFLYKGRGISSRGEDLVGFL